MFRRTYNYVIITGWDLHLPERSQVIILAFKSNERVIHSFPGPGINERILAAGYEQRHQDYGKKSEKTFEYCIHRKLSPFKRTIITQHEKPATWCITASHRIAMEYQGNIKGIEINVNT